MDWHFHLTLGLNRNQPSATRQAHRDVLDSTQHFPAVTISHPAKFGKQDAVVVLFQTGPLRIAKAGMLFLLLEPPFIRFLFAAACKSHSTRLWLQYQFLEIQFLRCREGIEYSRHRAVHPRHQCRGFSRWIGKRKAGGRSRRASLCRDRRTQLPLHELNFTALESRNSSFNSSRNCHSAISEISCEFRNIARLWRIFLSCPVTLQWKARSEWAKAPWARSWRSG